MHSGDFGVAGDARLPLVDEVAGMRHECVEPQRLAPPQLDLREIPIGDLPLYSYDFDKNYPPPARALKEAIASLSEDHAHIIRLPEPVSDADILFRALHAYLETLRTAAPIHGVRLDLIPQRRLGDVDLADLPLDVLQQPGQPVHLGAHARVLGRVGAAVDRDLVLLVVRLLEVVLALLGRRPAVLHRGDVVLPDRLVQAEDRRRRVHAAFGHAFLEGASLREREEPRRRLVTEPARPEVNAYPDVTLFVLHEVDVVVARADRAELPARLRLQLLPLLAGDGVPGGVHEERVVAGRVVLVIQPIGGVDDWRALFHEAGHTEHFAFTSPNLKMEEKRLGDNAVTEGWAQVIEQLTRQVFQSFPAAVLNMLVALVVVLVVIGVDIGIALLSEPSVQLANGIQWLFHHRWRQSLLTFVKIDRQSSPQSAYFF